MGLRWHSATFTLQDYTIAKDVRIRRICPASGKNRENIFKPTSLIIFFFAKIKWRHGIWDWPVSAGKKASSFAMISSRALLTNHYGESGHSIPKIALKSIGRYRSGHQGVSIDESCEPILHGKSLTYCPSDVDKKALETMTLTTVPIDVNSVWSVGPLTK